MDHKPTDLRRYAANTRKRLIVGGLVLILGLGAGLIAALYGTPAAVCGFSAFLIALVPVALIAFFLLLLQWIVRRAERMDESAADDRDDRKR
jgi:membrane protein implicated in regulation of membrane protease activity